MQVRTRETQGTEMKNIQNQGKTSIFKQAFWSTIYIVIMLAFYFIQSHIFTLMFILFLQVAFYYLSQVERLFRICVGKSLDTYQKLELVKGDAIIRKQMKNNNFTHQQNFANQYEYFLRLKRYQVLKIVEFTIRNIGRGIGIILLYIYIPDLQLYILIFGVVLIFYIILYFYAKFLHFIIGLFKKKDMRTEERKKSVGKIYYTKMNASKFQKGYDNYGNKVVLFY